ncbi:MAG: glycosyltransferase family 2 protein [Acidobacteriota bacterium]
MHSVTGSESAPSPRLAVVVCTYNRASLLAGMLDSLTRQTLDREAFELIVVDDGSIDTTRQVVESFRGRLPLRYAYQRNAGLASAKNHGLFLTRAALLLFLDDDDLAHPELLERHVRMHERFSAEHDAVLGYTALDAGLADDPLMHFVTEVGCFLFSYPNINDGDILDYSYFWGGRSSCKRSFLLRHGVFNPVFRFGCEDIELGFRLSRHHLRVVFDARAISTMVRGMTVEGFCDRLVRQGRSNAAFSRLHADDEVQRWTEVTGAGESWRRIAPDYEAMMRSARWLDWMARCKRQVGLPLVESEVQWLHHAYWTVFRAAKLKGIDEATRLGGEQSPRKAM